MKKFFATILAVTLALMTTAAAYAFERPVDQTEDLGDTPEYEGVTTITSGTNLAETTYTSTTDEQIALFVTGGSSFIASPTVTKSGDGWHGWVDFGSNAGILVRNGATLSIKGGLVTTSGLYSPGVFSDGSTIKLQDFTITTSGDYSTGLGTTSSANVSSNNTTVATSGSHSPAVTSTSGGSSIAVSAGEYTTSGASSPSLYARSRISIDKAAFTAKKSESLIIEGANAVAVTDSTLESSVSTPYLGNNLRAGIILYQPTSTHDAPVGTTTFTATGSTLTSSDANFFVTNANANITLKNNEITSSSDTFLQALASNWGESRVNGGNVTMALDDQSIRGDFITDSDSSLNLTLANSSSITGAINTKNTAKNISLTLSADSIITLTANSYVDSLKNADPTNYNIRLNGYTLEVGGVVLTSTYHGNITVDDDYDPFEVTDVEEEDFLTSLPVWVLPVSIIASILVFSSIAAFIIYKIRQKDNPETPASQIMSAAPGAPNPFAETTANTTGVAPLPPSPLQTSQGNTDSSQPLVPPAPPSTS